MVPSADWHFALFRGRRKSPPRNRSFAGTGRRSKVSPLLMAVPPQRLKYSPRFSVPPVNLQKEFHQYFRKLLLPFLVRERFSSRAQRQRLLFHFSERNLLISREASS